MTMRRDSSAPEKIAPVFSQRQKVMVRNNGKVGIDTCGGQWVYHTTGSHSHSHTPLPSSLRPADCCLASISEEHSNSAVVVPEELPRGRSGKQGKEAGRPRGVCPPARSPVTEFQRRLETHRNSACEEEPTP